MSIFPFISPESYVNTTTSADELPLFREYAYDFEGNRLLLRNGRTYLVEGNEALRIWIYKALLTPRFRHIAYTRAYGNEAQTLLNQVNDRDIIRSELRRFIIEALMVNPYIKELGGFDFTFEGSQVTVAFACTTVYGEMQVEYMERMVA